uniref:Putative caffeoyl-CoA O-methyltransferase 3 n=1 Tax=Lygus hesperus TaxID=30085 RepID=A0A0A9X4S0_LYGHE
MLQNLVRLCGTVQFDAVLVDADKTRYLEYLQLTQQLLAPNGVLFFDNAVWRNGLYNHCHTRLLTTSDAFAPHTFTVEEVQRAYPDDPALYYSVHKTFLVEPPDTCTLHQYVRKLRRETRWL